MTSKRMPSVTPCVLLLHRDREFLFAARQALRGEGFRVMPVTTGRDALDYLRQRGPAEVVVLGTPSRQGMSLQAAVRRLRPAVPQVLFPWKERDRFAVERLVEEVRQALAS